MKSIKLVMSALAFCGALSVYAAQKNVVVILVDDLGWSDIACYGSTFYDTPNIDRLAKQGVRFTDGYAAHPVCSPTRAAMMTGKNPCRKEINITNWIPGSRPKNKRLLGPKINNSLPLSEVTIAETLHDAGYSTWFLGKWHLGETATHWPLKQGFDVNIGGHNKGSPPGGYYSPYKNPVLTNGPDGEYLPDRLTNEAISLVKNRDKQKPFLLYLSFYTVHTPIQPCKRHLERYQKKLATLPKLKKAATVKENHGVTRARQDNAAYASMVYAMDENVGRLLKALKECGVDDNTVIFFTGDNGGLSTLTRSPGPTCELPLRAGKGWTYEGGIRVPYIIRDPAASSNGTTCDIPVVNTDFFATILDCCGLPLQPQLHIDSVTLKPLLNGEKSLKRTEPLIWHFPHYHGSGFPPGSCIREGDWKMVESYHDQTVELYNLKSDIGETKDLAKKFPEKTALLRKKMHDYLKKVDASISSINPAFNPKKTAVESDIRLHPNGKGWRLDQAKIIDKARPRVLLIGDSILNGYLKLTIRSLADKAYVDGWVNPYCQSKHFNKLLEEVLENGPYDVVHINLGLHGWQKGRIKEGTFEPLTKEFVQVIERKNPKAKIIWASSTPVTVKGKPLELNPEINPVIIEHNRMAAKVMQELNVPINDFYSLLVDKRKLAAGDQFHWKRPAYHILTTAVTNAVLQVLP